MVSVNIDCPLCPEETPSSFKDWEEYAKHVLKAHESDQERCTWAANALAAKGNTELRIIKIKEE